MRWGISFNVPATLDSTLWYLPPPSCTHKIQRWDGTILTNIVYHFQYSPQSWKEWQRVAGIKAQIATNIKEIEFLEYEPSYVSGKIYTISELGKHFKTFVKFPQPLFPGKRKEAYKMLCMHAKRLHYEKLLHIEQLIATSIRFNAVDPEGPSQTVKRAKAAHQFALDHNDTWKVKLDEKDLHNVLSESAMKSAQSRREKSTPQRKLAKQLHYIGCSNREIAATLGVSDRTISRWLKE